MDPRTEHLGRARSRPRALTAASAVPLALLGLLGAFDATLGEDRSLADRLEQVAAARVADGTVPGLAVALLDDGEIVLARGFGWANEKERRPMTASTPINVASISKSVAAWGFLRFCAHLGLSLDAPILPMLPSLSLPGARSFGADGVTVRRILSHSAGLSTPSAPVFPADRSLPSLESILVRGEGGVPRLELFMPPGVAFSYSGGGYLLLQHALERKTGESFARFMERQVLAPAGMTSSSFRLSAEMRAAAATYYRPKRRVRATYQLPGAAGGLYSTAEDMARWLALYAPRSVTRRQILSDADFRTLLEPRLPMALDGVDTGGAGYALGHATRVSPEGVFYVFHGGGNPGLRSHYFVSPETGDGMFVVANHDDGQVVFRELFDAWAAHQGVAAPPLF